MVDTNSLPQIIYRIGINQFLYWKSSWKIKHTFHVLSNRIFLVTVKSFEKKFERGNDNTAKSESIASAKFFREDNDNTVRKNDDNGLRSTPRYRIRLDRKNLWHYDSMEYVIFLHHFKCTSAVFSCLKEICQFYISKS